MKNTIREGEIKVGVLGAFRGDSFAGTAAHSGMKLVAICDNFEYRLDQISKKYNVKGYLDFNDFIKHDMDAVVVAAPFHLHAGFAMAALDSGKHVLSETSCNITLAEGVELYRKAEESQLCYMLAENYCYTKFNQEMKKLYDQGEIGEVMYAEGEYNHPMEANDIMWHSPGKNHWRHHIPGCYYNTHALAPMMYITGVYPMEVSCLTVPFPENDGRVYVSKKKNKGPFVIMLKMSNGSVFRIIGGGFPGHSCWYGFHGSQGAMECSRGHGYFGPETVRVWHEPWELREGQVEEKVYMPNWFEQGEAANRTGHGGGDFFVEYHFANAIRTGRQPYLNAYNGITMTNVGILAWRSVHADGKYIRVPDLRSEADQKEMLKDRLSPFAGVPNSELMPPEMLAPADFTPEVQELARKNWKRLGYTDLEIEEMLK